MGEDTVAMRPCHQTRRLWAWRGPHEDCLYSLRSSADRVGAREGGREGERVGVGVAGSCFCFQACPRSRFALRNWVYFLSLGLMLPTASGTAEMSSLVQSKQRGRGTLHGQRGAALSFTKAALCGCKTHRARFTSPWGSKPAAASCLLKSSDQRFPNCNCFLGNLCSIHTHTHKQAEYPHTEKRI